MSDPFGYHLIMDLYRCKKETCSDLDFARKFLINLVEFLGMQKISDPVVIRADEKKYPHLVGYSGWIPLIESGIQVHAISMTRFASIDVYSCKKFDPEKVKDFVVERFGCEKLSKHFITRGEEYRQHAE